MMAYIAREMVPKEYIATDSRQIENIIMNIHNMTQIHRWQTIIQMPLHIICDRLHIVRSSHILVPIIFCMSVHLHKTYISMYHDNIIISIAAA